MIYGYLDETGHSSDESQRFNGMAGFLAQKHDWECVEKKWKATLKRFGIPHFHMKDFAHFRGFFAGWSEQKRQQLLGKLFTHLESINPIPIGVIFDMEAFRSLPSQKLEHLTEPYMLSRSAMLSLTGGMLDAIGLKGRTTIIFSEQVEFRQCAHDYYRYAVSRELLVGKLIAPPVFGDLREVTPLQAADIMAYERDKECDSQFTAPSRKPRHGFEVITRMRNRIGWSRPGYKFIGKSELLAFINASEALDRRQAYWKNRRTKSQDHSWLSGSSFSI